MNRAFKIILLVYFLTILQVAILDSFSLPGLTADIFLVAIIFFAVYKDIEDTLVLSLIAGVFKGALSLPHCGFYIIAYPVIGISVAELNRVFF